MNYDLKVFAKAKLGQFMMWLPIHNVLSAEKVSWKRVVGRSVGWGQKRGVRAEQFTAVKQDVVITEYSTMGCSHSSTCVVISGAFLGLLHVFKAQMFTFLHYIFIHLPKMCQFLLEQQVSLWLYSHVCVIWIFVPMVYVEFMEQGGLLQFMCSFYYLPAQSLCTPSVNPLKLLSVRSQSLFD